MFITTLSVKNNLRGNYSNFKRFLVNILFLSGFNRPIKYQIDSLVRLSLTLQSFSTDKLLCLCLAIAIFPTLFYDTLFVLGYNGVKHEGTP